MSLCSSVWTRSGTPLFWLAFLGAVSVLSVHLKVDTCLKWLKLTFLCLGVWVDIKEELLSAWCNLLQFAYRCLWTEAQVQGGRVTLCTASWVTLRAYGRHIRSSCKGLLFGRAYRESWSCFNRDAKPSCYSKYGFCTFVMFNLTWEIRDKDVMLLCRCYRIQCIHWRINKEERKHWRSNRCFPEDEAGTVQTNHWDIQLDDKFIRKGFSFHLNIVVFGRCHVHVHWVLFSGK